MAEQRTERRAALNPDCPFEMLALQEFGGAGLFPNALPGEC